MADKLGPGDLFPSMTLSLVGGGEVNLPERLDAKYNVALFYRGHWWPYCRRQLVAFEEYKDSLIKLDVKILAASVDTGDASREVADEVSFEIAEGVTREEANQLGAWYGDARHPEMIQPSEFLVKADGKVMMSSYSAGPLGRINPDDLIKVINFLESLPK